MFVALWDLEPNVVRILAVVIIGVFLVAAARYTRLAFRLYRPGQRQRLLDKIAQGPPDPEVAAAFALLSPWLPGAGVQIQGSEDAVNRGQAEFSYVWGRCNLEVQSGRRAFVETLMLTMVAAIFSILPTFAGPCNNPNAVDLFCIFHGLGPSLILLSWGIFLSSVLYSAAMFFERVLQRRKLAWNILHARRSE